MEKVVRDGMVAVLYSPGYGAGWYTWNNKEELLFDPEVVKLVEEDKRNEIPAYVELKYPGEYVCHLGAEDLQITWLKQGTEFEISEYDGYESVRVLDDQDFIIA